MSILKSIKLRNRPILGFKQFVYGKSKTSEFGISRGLTITVFKESLKGPFVEIEYTTADSESFINQLVDNSKIIDKQIYDTESFSKIPLFIEFEKERLFDSANRLNKHIKDYCTRHGVEIRTDSLTLQSRLEGVSNDYSDVEESFKDSSGISLVDGDISNIWEPSFMQGISIIIPSYNSHDKLEYTLRSINSQSLSNDEFKKVEVIVVDDCSKVGTLEIIQKKNLNLNIHVNLPGLIRTWM